MENNKSGSRILIVDDETELCRSLSVLLKREGYRTECAHSGRDALSALSRQHFDLIICDLVMPDIGGIRLLTRLKQEIPVIMITAHASVDTARQAFKLGVHDYITKPVEFDELRVVVKSALDEKDRDDSNDLSKSFVSDTGNEHFRQLLTVAERFAPTDMPVLISGESGVGKERLADHIVRRSNRAEKPYLKINCAAIPTALLESELFGHERGAFTGAAEKKIGKVEMADGGTLLLDEIGDMPMELQAKLLRFFQDFRFERLGSTETIESDLRIIACTNQNLKKKMETGLFRDDLYHRLNGITLHIPPLRNRREDTDLLFDYFVSEFRKKYDKTIENVDQAVRKLVGTYSWPGNIRELRNVVERAVVMCDDLVLKTEDLPPALTEQAAEAVPYETTEQDVDSSEREQSLQKDMEQAHEQFMRNIIVEALKQHGGNRSRTASSLGISRKTLYNWIRRLRIRNEFL